MRVVLQVPLRLTPPTDAAVDTVASQSDSQLGTNVMGGRNEQAQQQGCRVEPPLSLTTTAPSVYDQCRKSTWNGSSC
jgi:hypothetical protein